ncbi:MAG: hypothetical protein H6974_13520 [Gammaproteobacteria bacterium]|nr:hypothetical protein [Gammaproteobacteria bacterium]
MMINSAINAGIASIQGGIKSLEDSAQEIASQPVRSIEPIGERANGPPTETNRPVPRTNSLAEPLIEQRTALYRAQAGAKIISTANEMLGSLLDVTI